MKISFLSRGQELKKCMVQLATNYRVPLDIIKLIYNYKRKSEIEDEGQVRLFYKNIIFILTLDTKGINSPVKLNHRNNLYEKKQLILLWLSNYDIMNQKYNLMKNDIYYYRLPNGKNCEWAIKHTNLKKLNDVDDGKDREFNESRYRLIYEINILGESNYLMNESRGLGAWHTHLNVAEASAHLIITPCNLKKKIKYLNTSPLEEIICDYETYLEHKGDYDENNWRLMVDYSGDSYYI